MQTKGCPFYPFFLVNLLFTSAIHFFLSARTEYRDVSRHPLLFILFRAAEKEDPYSREIYPFYPFFLVNLPFTSAIHFFFLCDQKEKDDKKKEVAAQNGLSLTAFANDGAANSLCSDAAWIRHRQTPYPVFDRSARS